MIKHYFFLFILLSINAFALTPTDPKMCGFVARDASGDIKRSSATLRAFQIVHPCPSTGLTIGPCPDWSIDHIIPLACGGCDAIVNMQWLPNRGKNCDHNYCKDRFERQIQYVDPKMPGLIIRSCNPKILPKEYFDE